MKVVTNAGCAAISRNDSRNIAAFSGLFNHVERPEGCGSTMTSNNLPARFAL